MHAPAADVNPKTLENAKRRFVELYGTALVRNTEYRIALVLVSTLAIAVVVRDFYIVSARPAVELRVVRVEAVGRAEAVRYDAANYQPEPPELRYFLTQFIVKHFSRLRSTVERDYPDSLHFLAPRILDATIAANDRATHLDDQQPGSIEGFLRNRAASEIDVIVRNVSLGELSRVTDADPETGPDHQPLYSYKGTAAVDFQRVAYTSGTRSERRRDTFVAQIGFKMLRPDRVPNDLVPANPLGFQITSLHIDQAFGEAPR